jgi:branched-chain amino acid aminotransferase
MAPGSRDLRTARSMFYCYASEVLVTSTAGGIMPVTVIDGQPVGTGAPGPLTRQLRDRYWASHEDPRYLTPVRYDEPG